MSLKNYSLKELKDEVERRENAAHSRQWSRQKKHYEEKGWRLDPKVDVLLARCVSANPVPENNMIFYSENIPIAEDYAFVGITQHF